MSIHYTIAPAEPDAHRFTVSVCITEPDPAGQCLSLPNWIPGSYMIRDFSRHLTTLSASDGAQAVELEKIDKSRWRAPAGLARLDVRYEVYAWDLSVRAAHLDRQHGFFNGTSVFLLVDGQESARVTVDIERPPSPVDGHWQVATSLPSETVDADGFGRYVAQDYDELIDHPVEMGAFERVIFHACGVPHELVLTGSYHTDTARIMADLTRICEHHIRFFGEPAPVERYVFLVMVVDKGYGGLEHRASTALMISANNLPTPGREAIDDAYLEFLGLCSHEYFHTWNVKRIKPAAFVPYQLQAESYTRLLWFFEGITSYYDDLALVRCGLIDQARYLKLLAATATRVRRGAGSRRQSVTDSSFDAWHKFYKQDENAGNAIVSYYAKGALVALCLDARLRVSTDQLVSLDTLMTKLWQQWLESGKGLHEQGPERLASELAGVDLQPFFDQALYGTDELPLVEAAQALGVRLVWRERQNAADTGGSVEGGTPALPALGATVVEEHGRCTVRQVANGGAAESAGLAAGDHLVAMNQLMVEHGNLARILARHSDMDSFDVHYARHGVLRSGRLPVIAPTCDTAVFSVGDESLADRWMGIADENQPTDE